jgi:halimadienyl-diphosphate synthase
MTNYPEVNVLADEKLDTDIVHLLTCLKPDSSSMDSVAYDTAWVARLSPQFPKQGFDEALPWLRHHQHPDGSWGSEVLHYHDRIISTLSAMIALHNAGRSVDDERRIRQGAAFLWRENGRLHHDANDTIGFPILAYSLVNEAVDLGLDIPRDLYQDVAKIEKKLNMLGSNPHMWRYTTLAVSLEALRSFIPDDANFIEANGSVGTSPAATVASLLKNHDDRAVRYLQQVVAEQNDGGAPFVKPIDIFEALWTLNHLRLANAITPDNPDVRRILDFVWSNWSPEKGLSYSPYFPVTDLDDTAVAFGLLRWAGYAVNADVFKPYEHDQHFCCYPGELDQSLSVNIRLIAALQMDRQYQHFDNWTQKISAMLRRFDLTGYFWFDKWHVSPYYLTATAVWSLHGIVDDLLPSRIKWMLHTQRDDGGWGYYNHSTVEETAYCLHALLYWDEHTTERIDPNILESAAQYLTDRFDDTHYPAMWIGKSLYTPRNVVRSAVLSALYSYREHMATGSRSVFPAAVYLPQNSSRNA